MHGNGLYTQDLYYKILNCGFRLPPSAGSASGVLANPVGYNRVYVHADHEFGWDQWWDGLRAGRCFVTNGPLLRLTANGQLPGAALEARFRLTIVVSGKLDSREPIHRIELVRNGSVSEIGLPATITVEEPGWFLVRAIADVDETFRFASTAPWYVGEQAMRPDRETAGFFLKWAKERKAMVEERLVDEGKRREVAAVHEKAVRFWEGMVDKADARGLAP